MDNTNGNSGRRTIRIRTIFTPLIRLIYAALSSALFIYLGERIIRRDELYDWLRSETGDFAMWISVAAVALAIIAISLVTTKLSAGVACVGALSVVAHSIQYFKTELRGEPFYPWDIFQYREAMSIADDVELKFTQEITSAIAYTIVIIAGAVLLDIIFSYPKFARYIFRLGAAVSVFGLLWLYFDGVIWNQSLMADHGIQLVLFKEKDSYNTGGFFLTFAQNAEEMAVKAPEDYSKPAVLEISEKYENKDGGTPNVIIVMSEAFANPDQYENLKFNVEPTPVINRLSDKFLSGKVLTQSYGGGTSISEYEVLTGNSASYLPEGSVPYMQYVRQKTDSYASFLKNLGYETVAIHPYTPDFWCRNKAYPLMGFDKFLSKDDFVDPEYPRGQFISDMDLTEKIIEEYEASDSGKPFFALGVSMQNHAYYGGTYENGTIELVGGEGRDETLSQISDEMKSSIQNYVTGAHLADEALGALIDYFSDCGEDTVIVFFGDHQPYLGEVSLDLIGLTSPDNTDAENKKLCYTTPYIIWNNFGAGDAEKHDISMYQLLPLMTEKLGLARPAYFEFLSDIRNTFSGHVRFLALAPDGSPSSTMTAEQEKFNHNHWLVQYDNMFGKNFAEMW